MGERKRQQDQGTTASSRLFEPVDAYPLALFRICFGLLLMWDVLRWLRLDIGTTFLAPREPKFHYPLLEWIAPPGDVVQALLILQLIALALITVGVFYRTAMLTFCFSFAVFFFSDMVFYNNHLYLMFLLSLVLPFMRADAVLSPFAPTRNQGMVPAWNLWLLRFFLILVYFYGGLAKLNADWLVDMQPVKAILAIASNRSSLAGLCDNAFGQYFICYGGVVFDLLIGFMLLSRRTRKLSIVLLLVFHLTNGLVLFNDIYIFPFFMICATVLFLEPAWVGRTCRKLTGGKKADDIDLESGPLFPPNRRVPIALAILCAFQLLFPFRAGLIEGNGFWTREGHYFSWRMKSQHREIELIRFVMHDLDGEYPDYVFDIWRDGGPVEESFTLVHLSSVEKMFLLGKNPACVKQFADHLEGAFKELGTVRNMEIRAEIRVSMNGRPPQYLVDPEIDLLQVELDPIGHDSWITPLQE